MAGSTIPPAVVDGTKLAGADLRTARGCYVTLSNGAWVLAATAGQFAHGVLLNAPNTGEAAEVCLLGVCPHRAPNSTAVALNALLGVQVTTGRPVTIATAGHFVLSRAMEAVANTNASGTFFEAMFNPQGQIPA